MKIAILSYIAVVFRTCALAQGTVDLSNYEPYGGIFGGTDVNAPFFDDRGVPLAGASYVAQLYAGNTAGSMVAVGLPTPFTTNGYFYPEGVRIPGNLPGTMIWVQVRAWVAACGSTYEQALAAGCWTGRSNELFLQTGGFGLPPSTPAELIGLAFVGVPEPSAATLLLLGAGVFTVLERLRIKSWT